jgi:hypothetical protein
MHREGAWAGFLGNGHVHSDQEHKFDALYWNDE